MTIDQFGQNSFVTHTTGLIERIEKMENEYICLSGEHTFGEDGVLECADCGRKSCPKCSDDVVTIQEYEETIRINSRESE